MVPRSRKFCAVPFVGKDVPSPASEFSFPDIVIGLSILAYRYQVAGAPSRCPSLCPPAPCHPLVAPHRGWPSSNDLHWCCWQGLRESDFKWALRCLRESMAHETGKYSERPTAVMYQDWVKRAGGRLRGKKPRRISRLDTGEILVPEEDEVEESEETGPEVVCPLSTLRMPTSAARLSPHAPLLPSAKWRPRLQVSDGHVCATWIGRCQPSSATSGRCTLWT